MAQRYCKQCGQWHDLEMPWPHEPKPVARSELSAPMLIRDSMDALKSMVDGLVYDSKSALRKAYKRKGVIEVGDQAPILNKAPVYTSCKTDLIDAYKKVKAGYEPSPLSKLPKSKSNLDLNSLT